MTRNHFRAIARILKQQNADPLMIREFANMFAEQNAYFDRDRFYTASGLKE